MHSTAENKRQLKSEAHAHHCYLCSAMATHAVTDAVESAPGEWAETSPRYGCAAHPVVSRVTTFAGVVQTFAEFQQKAAAV